MAILFGSDLHQCKTCDTVEFEEVVIKSYNQTRKDVIKTNSAIKYLRCVKCGNLTPVGENTGLMIEE